MSAETTTDQTALETKSRAPPRIWLIAILGVATGLRLGYALLLPHEFPPWRDGQHYLAIAHNLVENSTYCDSIGLWPNQPVYSDAGPTSFWLPAYPVFLAGTFAVCGESLRTVYLIQAFVGGLVVLLTYQCAKLVLGTRLGLVAAALQGINPYQVFQVGRIAVEGSTALMLILALMLALACERTLRSKGSLSPLRWALLALVLGIGILTRSVFVLVASAVLGYLLTLHYLIKRRLALTLAAGLTAGLVALVAVSPWLVRNYRLWGRLIYHTKSGINLVIGYNDDATGAFSLDAVPRLDPAALDEIQRDALLTRLALGWMAAHPMRSAYLFAKKMVIIWNPVPQAPPGVQRLAALLWSATFLSLAWIGMIRALRRWRSFALPFIVIAAYVLTIALVFSITRFRIPIDGVLAVFAAFGLDLLVRLVYRLTPRRPPPHPPLGRLGYASPMRNSTAPSSPPMP